jgi:Chorismate mutase type II.
MDLAALRDAIADVDRALLELLRRRMELAAQVGRIKARGSSRVDLQACKLGTGRRFTTS